MKKVINWMLLAIIFLFGVTAITRGMLGALDGVMLRVYMSDADRAACVSTMMLEFELAKQAAIITATAIGAKFVFNWYIRKGRAR